MTTFKYTIFPVTPPGQFGLLPPIARGTLDADVPPWGAGDAIDKQHPDLPPGAYTVDIRADGMEPWGHSFSR